MCLDLLYTSCLCSFAAFSDRPHQCHLRLVNLPPLVCLSLCIIVASCGILSSLFCGFSLVFPLDWFDQLDWSLVWTLAFLIICKRVVYGHFYLLGQAGYVFTRVYAKTAEWISTNFWWQDGAWAEE